ncbi:delayed-early response protein/equilibrative nucleoside transporter [Pseudorhizobium endolithicum]|uniref:Nickel/cobalt efflux system n=1 Tax=Pseudorhizobium endolithicum TaxID=1191678 RepID=A0ABM8PP80_9HYPH|nr:nickel/cobalt transporter [Pseudorhizobium endolithicum]CAD7040359.1 delayed-early response protein/equilibrative nucleoside transporter [Pseudorhizobium endolithicum]
MRGRCLVLLTLALALAGAAQAQSPLGVGSAEPAFSVGGPLGGFLGWINDHQQAFYRALTGALKAMREDPRALLGLVGLSFAYGVFHAAGPGHGKAVISSYMIANTVELRRGVAISFLSSLLQGLVAILLVGTIFFLLRGSGITMTVATRAMEVASFALIALFGAWLLARKLLSLRNTESPAAAAFSVPSPAAALPPGGSPNSPSRFQAVEVTGHEHIGDGTYCEACGHAHAPDPRLLGGGRFSVREAWSAILAVGLRPCSGAILVMSFSLLNGLYLGGLLSVLAMSLGTAITVSILAILAVTAKDLAVRFAGPGSRTAGRIATAFEMAGALFILLIGLSLLAATLQA